MLRLLTVDGGINLLSLDAAKLSPVLKDLSDGAEVTINADPDAVTKVIAYMEYYKESSRIASKFCRPLVSSDLSESGGNEHDCEFVKDLNDAQVHKMLDVAEGLKLDSLVELMAACIARTLRLWKATGHLKVEAGFRD